jgi:hypothetical protein
MYTEEMRLKVFYDAYLECIAWADCNEDQNEKFSDSLGFSSELLLEAKNDCKAFLTAVSDRLHDGNLSQAGHDFWLTRNGHGTGFWDRIGIYDTDDETEEDENMNFFNSLCHWKTGQFKEKYVYVGDDNLIYFG